MLMPVMPNLFCVPKRARCRTQGDCTQTRSVSRKDTVLSHIRKEGAVHGHVNKIFWTALSLFSSSSGSNKAQNFSLVYRLLYHANKILLFFLKSNEMGDCGWCDNATAVATILLAVGVVWGVSHPFPIMNHSAAHPSQSYSSQRSRLCLVNPSLDQPASACSSQTYHSAFSTIRAWLLATLHHQTTSNCIL